MCSKHFYLQITHDVIRNLFLHIPLWKHTCMSFTSGVSAQGHCSHQIDWIQPIAAQGHFNRDEHIGCCEGLNLWPSGYWTISLTTGPLGNALIQSYKQVQHREAQVLGSPTWQDARNKRKNIIPSQQPENEKLEIEVYFPKSICDLITWYMFFCFWITVTMFSLSDYYKPVICNPLLPNNPWVL